MKGRKTRPRRPRRCIKDNAMSACSECYDAIPESSEIAIESILLSPNQLYNTSNRSLTRKAKVGGIQVFLDLASGDEICVLAEKMQAFDKEATHCPNHMENLEDSLRKNRVFVARSLDGAVIAAAIYSPSAFARNRDGAVIGGFIYVDEHYRGRGVGKDFCGLCGEFAEKYDFQVILSEVSPQNDCAIRMLQGSGFEILCGLPRQQTDMKENGFQGEKLLVMKMLQSNVVMKLSRL